MMIEILLVAAFGVLYYNNFFDFKNLVTIPMMFISLAVIIGIDLVALWVEVGIFSKVRHQTDLKAADLIGADIQEAYNFGMIGLVIVDENNTVLWVNELFKERTC